MPPPPEILTPGQKQFLHALAATPLRQEFVFTGGTALSAIYLQHRFSEDLDFFTDNPHGVRPVWSLLEPVFSHLKINPKPLRRVETFCSFIANFEDGESFKVDFAVDTPFRLAPPELLPEYGINADGLADIASNKLSALFDRAESKDFVDIYFLTKERIAPDELIQKARQKHIGLDDYYLAQAFLRVKELNHLPRMIKQITLKELETMFENWAAQLAKNFS